MLSHSSEDVFVFLSVLLCEYAFVADFLFFSGASYSEGVFLDEDSFFFSACVEAWGELSFVVLGDVCDFEAGGGCALDFLASDFEGLF